MNSEDTSSSPISIGFPFGLALLFTMIMFMCGFFCCCLHWDKVQSLLHSYGIVITQQTRSDLTPPPESHKPVLPFVTEKQGEVESLPVLMPGDEVPKFIAMACPCQPPRNDSLTIQVDKAVPPAAI